MASGTRLLMAIEQIKTARDYTLELISDIDDPLWYDQPHGTTTHVAWQVGHLAMAQYGLTILRIRGREREDSEWIAKDFIRKFQKGSQPIADAGEYPSPSEIRQVLATVHRHSLAVLDDCAEDDLLQESLPAPYAVFPNKLGSILFCPMHEMLHAGQIGLLRRLLGKQPIR
ncbi:MAG: DinB family protein [Pirellulaceae bacterium]